MADQLIARVRLMKSMHLVTVYTLIMSFGMVDVTSVVYYQTNRCRVIILSCFQLLFIPPMCSLIFDFSVSSQDFKLGPNGFCNVCPIHFKRLS